MPKHFRHSRGYHWGGSSWKGAIWMIGLGILFYTGDWWPGILILIGISTVLGAFWQGNQGRQRPDWNWEKPENTPAQPVEQQAQPAAVKVEAVRVAPEPIRPNLPGNCPSCGAPVRIPDVKWTSSKTAQCAYCGSLISGT